MGGLLNKMIENILELQFQEAVRNSNPQFKRDFLKGIPLADTLISKLVYVDGTHPGEYLKFADGRLAEMPQVSMFRQFSPYQKRKILVYPAAFIPDTHNQYADLLSTLIDHEEFHIKQYNKHSFELWLNSLKCLTSGNAEVFQMGHASTELPAFENQLKNADLRGISPKYRDILERIVESILKRYQPMNEITDKKLFYELA